MADSNFSCLKEVTKVVQIILPAEYTSNEISGISDVLESWKCQYIKQLNAVVVNYKNVSLDSVCGLAKLDCCLVNCSVKATFELFYPTIGSIVEGKINRVSHDHIGCLVHNTINVTVGKPRNLSNGANFIALDNVILFEISGINYKRKIIHVKGKITEKCVNLMRETGLLDFEVNPVEDNGIINRSQHSYETSTDNSKSRKGLKRKIDALNSVAEEISTDSGHHSPKKKKSKKSNYDMLENYLSPNSSTPDLDFGNSTDLSSQASSSSKKKKHKKSKDEPVTSPLLFNESLDSEINEIEPTQLLERVSKKNSKSQIHYSLNDVDAMINEIKNEIHTDSSNSQKSPTKSPKKKKSPSKSSKNEIIPNSFLENSSNHKSPTKSSKKKKSLSKSSENEIIPNNFLQNINNHKSPAKSSKKKTSLSISSENDIIPHDISLQNLSCENATPSKKKKSKKTKENSSKSSSKKHKKSKTKSPSVKVKNEIDTDFQTSSMSPIKSIENSGFSENFKDVYDMVEALSSFEPPLEDQLLNDKVSLSAVGKNQRDTAKSGKKRKRESTDVNSLPKKKSKVTDQSTSSKSKTEKKKKKEKPKKNSKKDKKKKPKVISSKKKLAGYKNKFKKKSKENPDKGKSKKKT